MVNVPKNLDRERMDAVLDWATGLARQNHVLRVRLSKYRDAELGKIVVEDAGLLSRLAEEES